ncbi:MAG: sigma-70 family RNA polymerase sigma factor [Acidobacteriota bacterium]
MSFERYTDAELVQEMLPESGEATWKIEAAWCEFISRFEKLLVKTIRLTYRRYLAQHKPTFEDVCDLVQQSFVKIAENNYRALRELDFREENSVKMYLFTIASHATLDSLRASQALRRPTITNSLGEVEYIQDCVACYYAAPYASSYVDPEKQYLQKELIEQVLAVVDAESDDKTRERNRRIFLLAHCDGYTRSEIAECEDIGLKRTGVNSVLNRVKKRLKELKDAGELGEFAVAQTRSTDR